MISELEKQFFDTFGIEPREFKSCDVGTFCPYPEKECGTDTCPYYRTYKVDYPAISDHILLNLICIANKYEYYPTSTNIKNIQARTLRILLKAKKYLKDTYLHQGCHNSLVRKVRTLFEEG